MNKHKKIMITVITVLILTIGVTFAYFMAKTGAGASSNVNITADTVDDLKFSVSKDNLTLNINQFNFTSGSGNLSDSITATASLKANSTKKTATYNYYVYFQIESNEYIYTTTDKKPEIVLTITGPNGEITSVDGLTYVTATSADETQVKGFDITELKSSIIKIADSFEISSSSSTNYTNQDWVLKVTFINLDTNQVDNENRKLFGKVLIQKEAYIPTLADVASKGDNLVSSIKTLSTKESSNITNLYYHDSSLTNGAGDNSYRYAGSNPNNYVCFGYDEKSSDYKEDVKCPSSNLYRIIGIFNDKVKLIKSTTYTSANWDSVYRNLNDNLMMQFDADAISGTGTAWGSKISKRVWEMATLNWDSIDTQPKTLYQNEIVNSSNSNTDTYSSGLMFISDYAFGASPEYWTSTLSAYNKKNITSSNWLYLGQDEWTTTYYDFGGSSVIISASGKPSSENQLTSHNIRPTFYLKADTQYISGSGTSSDPIIIN